MEPVSYLPPSNPYEGTPNYSFEDEDGGRQGRVDLWYVYYERNPYRNPSAAPQQKAGASLETAVVLTKVMGYGTTAIAKLIIDVKIALMQERGVAEFVVFHDWMETDGYAIGAKELMFRAATNMSIRKRMKEVRILCGKGLFSSVIEAGLTLSGFKNTQIMHDARHYHAEICSILGRYDTRTLLSRVEPFHPMPNR